MYYKRYMCSRSHGVGKGKSERLRRKLIPMGDDGLLFRPNLLFGGKEKARISAPSFGNDGGAAYFCTLSIYAGPILPNQRPYRGRSRAWPPIGRLSHEQGNVFCFNFDWGDVTPCPAVATFPPGRLIRKDDDFCARARRFPAPMSRRVAYAAIPYVALPSISARARRCRFLIRTFDGADPTQRSLLNTTDPTRLLSWEPATGCS